MKITETRNVNQVTLRVEGSLDTNTAPELEATLNRILDGSRIDMTIDFSDLDYLSSAGLRVLLSAQKKTNEAVGSLIIRNVNDTIMEIFEVTGFSDFLTIEN